MLELRHMVPEVVDVRRVAVVDMSTDRHAGQDTADKLRFWSPEAQRGGDCTRWPGRR